MSERPDWDAWGLGVAAAVATRAECVRRHVGAVIADTRHRIVSTGYNGAPAGHHPTCLEGGCPRGISTYPRGAGYHTPEGWCIAVHAEMNAIIQADPQRLPGATLYSTHESCDVCAKLITGTGISRTVYAAPL
jgi:dCMP deaminase